jgi:hypothetical protein
MSQHDFTIDNQSAPNARTDINNALKALASLSSGSTAPSTTYANMLWYDTGTNTLNMRAEADDAWISVAYLNQSSDTFNLLDDTQVVDSGGTQTGLIGDQSTAVWEAGTGTTESLVSPAKIKSAIEALVTSDTTGFSSSQSWSDETSSRAFGTTYTNSTGRMIQVAVTALGGLSGGPDSFRQAFTISNLVGGTTISETVGTQEPTGSTSDNTQSLIFNVPNGSTYRVNQSSSPSLESWFELG